MNKLLLLVTIVLFSSQMRGAGQVLAAPLDDKGLTISPPSREVTLVPGQSVVQTVKVSNPTTSIIEVYPVALDFKAKGETGEPSFTNAPKEKNDKFSLSSWIVFPQSRLALAPQQVIDFSYTLVVPKDAEPGGHYGAVFFANEPPVLENTSSKVAVTSMVGTLLLANVPGNVREDSKLEDLETNKTFYFSAPVEFGYRINNQGNVHFRPRGEIVIKNMKGEVVDTLQVNQSQGNVLPTSTRRFSEKWSPTNSPIGRFTANLVVIYGDGKTLNSTISFWIIPAWLIAAVSGGLIVILAFAILIRIIIKQRK